MIFQYNPYAPGGQQPGQVGNPFGQQQAAGPKTFSIPTWLFWLIIIGFVGFAGWLTYYLFFT